MGPVVRLVGKGIGLASEALAARKESKARDKSPGPATNHGRVPSPVPGSASIRDADDSVPPDAPPAYDTLDPSSAHYGVVETRDDKHAAELIERGHAVPYDPNGMDLDPNEASHFQDDEAMWELDEAAALQDPSSTVLDEPQDDKDKPDVRKLIQKFLTAHPAPSVTPPRNPLQCPVIIPQRRPHSKGRGFVQAYAPVLETAGIDQATFMDFLATFHKASQASPVFEVIFLAGHLVGYAPTLTAMAISIPIQVAAGTAIVAQSRYRYAPIDMPMPCPNMLTALLFIEPMTSSPLSITTSSTPVAFTPSLSPTNLRNAHHSPPNPWIYPTPSRRPSNQKAWAAR